MHALALALAMGLSVAVVGAIEFTASCLVKVLTLPEVAVRAVVTLPPDEGRRRHSDYADLAPLARASGVPVVSGVPDAEWLRDLDLLLVLGWSRLLPPTLLRAPRLGTLGSHPSLLPIGRGRHPLIWTLVQGLTQSGLTLLWLADDPDAGDIAWQRACPVGPDDTARTLYDRVTALALDGLGELLPRLARGDVPRRPQAHALATSWRKRLPADGDLDALSDPEARWNLVRALGPPYPGATMTMHGRRVRVLPCA